MSGSKFAATPKMLSTLAKHAGPVKSVKLKVKFEKDDKKESKSVEKAEKKAGKS